MFKKFVLGIIFAITLIVFINSDIFASFGVSPADLTVENLLPGGVYEKEFLLSRADLENDTNIVVEIDVEGGGDWIEVEPGIAFTIPKGQRTERVKLTVKVPEEAPLRVYEGYITVKAVTGKNASGVAVVGGVGIKVKLAVGEEKIHKLLIRNMNIPKLFEGEPIHLLLTIENQGNIEASPEKVEIVVDDSFGNEVLKSEKTNFIKIIPGRTEELRVEFDNDLKKGNYGADVKVVFENNSLAENKLFFSINEKVDKGEEQDVKTLFRVNNILLLLGLLVFLSLLVIALKKLLKNKII
jgi:hypothetical protein